MQVDEGARQKYTAAFDAYADALEQLALRNRGRYVGVPITMPLEEVIFGPLMRLNRIA